jgi:broad specificity phosphatase PhoE
MSTRILLIRHAETARPDLLHGSESDVDISPRGERQAEAIGRVLVAEKPDALICSGMLRARRTADAIARATGLIPRIEPRLHERSIGVLAGKEKSIVKSLTDLWPGTIRRWKAGETSYTTEGAESLDDILARVLPVVTALALEFDGRKLVLVTHGMMSKVLLLSILSGYSLADWDRIGSIRNCSISDVEWTGGTWLAHRVNEVPTEVAEVSRPTAG